MTDFPSVEYREAQKKWVGKDCIVTPMVLKGLEQKELIKNKRVIDIGCGSGHYSFDFLEWGASSVFGIDNSSEMIKSAQEKYKAEGLTFSADSIVEHSYNGEFDVAVAVFVLQFIHDKKDIEKALSNIFASLSPTGVLMAVVPNGSKEYNPKKEEGQKFGAAVDLEGVLVDGGLYPIRFYENGEAVGSSVTIRYSETYERLLKEAGFKKVEWLQPEISPEGIRNFGAEFFESYLNPPKDIVFRAWK